MIVRIGWTALIALLLGITAMAQLDRASRYRPALASLVPAQFQGFAAQHILTQKLVERDGDGALAAAKRLVRARPAPADHMRLLAQAAGLAEDEAVTLAALGAASQRGWRDPLVQHAAAEAALLEGNWAAASQRIAAQLATASLPDETGAQLGRLLMEEGGRQAFAELLAEPGRWHGNALRMAPGVASPPDLADTLSRAAAANANLPCFELGQIASSLEKGGFEEEAGRFWPGHCPAS